MNIDDVKQSIESWIKNFLEVDNPELDGWSPCPYARSARINNSYEVRLGTELYSDMMDIGREGLGDKEVVIFAYPINFYTPEEFADLVDKTNQGFLIPVDLIALDDHPNHQEEVNGVIFNHGDYALAMVQNLSDLNKKAHAIAKQGFYNRWPEEYLEELFQHREDPRHVRKD